MTRNKNINPPTLYPNVSLCQYLWRNDAMTSFDISIPAPKRIMAIPAPAKTWANPFTEKKPTTDARKIAQIKRR
jgi:hypothetical protein